MHVVSQRHGANKDMASQNDVATVKNQKKLDTTKKLTNKCFSKTQSVSETCKSPTDKAYSCRQVSIYYKL